MSCERLRPEIRDVALGAAPSRRLEAHLAFCAPCRARLEEECRRRDRIDDELEEALGVAPSPDLLPRVRQEASRAAGRKDSWRPAWLLPLAASLVALALLLVARRGSPPSPGMPEATPWTPAAAAAPPARAAEAPAPQIEEDTRKAPRSVWPTLRHVRLHAGRTVAAQARQEPEVIVPPGGEEALRRFVEAVGHRRMTHEDVRGLGPDEVHWIEVEDKVQSSRALDRLPAEAERVGAAPETVARTLGD